jgi:hypothetical protein
MTVVICKVTTAGVAVQTDSWVTGPSGPIYFDKATGKANVPPGTYQLKWYFIGDQGAKVTFTVDAKDSQTHKPPCVTGPWSIPNGKTRVSSTKYQPPGFKPAFFEVE